MCRVRLSSLFMSGITVPWFQRSFATLLDGYYRNKGRRSVCRRRGIHSADKVRFEGIIGKGAEKCGNSGKKCTELQRQCPSRSRALIRDHPSKQQQGIPFVGGPEERDSVANFRRFVLRGRAGPFHFRLVAARDSNVETRKGKEIIALSGNGVLRAPLRRITATLEPGHDESTPVSTK